MVYSGVGMENSGPSLNLNSLEFHLRWDFRNYMWLRDLVGLNDASTVFNFARDGSAFSSKVVDDRENLKIWVMWG